MSILEAALLGLVQGITEFLPISSSGHLLIVPAIFGWDAHAMDFDVVVHIATLLAVVWAFWPDLRRMANMARGKSKERQLVYKIIVATIPVGALGVFLAKTGLIEAIRDPAIILSGLMGWGVLLWVADIYSTKRKQKIVCSEDVTWKKSLLIGCVQALALLPGTSRSGITMTFGLFTGLNRKTAAHFSFLLAIPAIAGAGFVTGLDVLQSGFETDATPLVIGFISAFLSGVLAIKVLMHIVERTSYAWFGAYRILLGAILWLVLL